MKLVENNQKISNHKEIFQNTPIASLQRGKTPPPMSVLGMTLNNLMVMFSYVGALGNAE